MSLECSTYIERSKNMSTPPVKNNPPVAVNCCRSLEVLCAGLYLLSRKPPQSLYDRQLAPSQNTAHRLARPVYGMRAYSAYL